MHVLDPDGRGRPAYGRLHLATRGRAPKIRCFCWYLRYREMGAIFILRAAHPYLSIATVTVLVVGVGGLPPKPQFGAALVCERLVGGGAWVAWLFGHQSAVDPIERSRGFTRRRSHLAVLLGGIYRGRCFACAVAAQVHRHLYSSASTRTASWRALERKHGPSLWVSPWIRAAAFCRPLLIASDTMRVGAPSEFAATYLKDREVPLEGNNLFEVLKFSYPDVIHELITGSGGGSSLWPCSVGQTRMRPLTQVRVLHVKHKGRRLRAS